MNNDIVLKVTAKIITPFIIIYAFYIQFHGESSPGGGFQAGAILASAFILHTIIFNINYTLKVLSMRFLKITASIGVLTYVFVGIIPVLYGGNFLDYSYLNSNKLLGQKIGIMVIELGVGITVFSVIMIIFFSFIMRKTNV
ncbi:MAG: Na(+)/H(+) antiporter subunit B [Alphaproteobacteria bacterium]